MTAWTEYGQRDDTVSSLSDDALSAHSTDGGNDWNRDNPFADAGLAPRGLCGGLVNR